MKELNTEEIMNVSGAGKIQDTFSSWYGTIFSNLYSLTSSFSSVFGSSEEEAISNGEELGSEIGARIETFLSALIEPINQLIK
ncbi:hypothetical protein [Erwinia psidii]|uniref:Uncharacterized protein n=1 Tax=Erwinia psidii TaxID=69224 RepID=A0A3N6S9Z3_9GAMM|nr:hypothetical protein [Erwinia psidii]MCX8958976.1 hypothetical protein [Erwinia psidii]MCX8962824.1 hypothetical protein [Erwinia psidii]MCX8966142.1 hypothetical protein [Erwinia psidii]RQM36793.1 hypothetical protein EB241_18755 [Erwinia psidii]